MINTESNFKIYYYKQISSLDARQIALREEPAVYAWYRSFHALSEFDSPDDYVDAINGMLQAKLSTKISGKLGYLYEVELQESSGLLSEKKERLLKKIASSQDARNSLTNILKASSVLQSPLYIGKTNNLLVRIGEHISGVSGLLDRLESADIKFRDCVLRVLYLSAGDHDVFLNNENHELIILLIEDLLTRFSPAAFVKKPG